MSSTSNTGSPADADTPPAPDDETVGFRPLPLVMLLGGFVLVGVALVAGFQIFGALYGILFPPLPPILPDMREVSHQSSEHGVDDWRYLTQTTASEFTAFYTEQGGTCNTPADASGALDALLLDDDRGVLCSGVKTFSIFAMRWEVYLSPDRPDDTVRVSREVLWTGAPES